MSIVSSLDGYPGDGTDKLALKPLQQMYMSLYGQITLNNGKERINNVTCLFVCLFVLDNRRKGTR